MSLFGRNKSFGVQSFTVKLINHHCEELRALAEGPRGDRRVNLTLVTLVIPLEEGEPILQRSFYATTKEFSATGLAIVVHQPPTVKEVVLAFTWEEENQFIRATAMHHSTLGGGFYQIGFQLDEMIHDSDYPILKRVQF